MCGFLKQTNVQGVWFPAGLQISRSDYTEHKIYDVDPESHVLNSINDTCKYFTDDQFNDNVEVDNAFLLINVKCRTSLRSMNIWIYLKVNSN